MGLGPLADAIVQIEMDRSMLAWAMNCFSMTERAADSDATGMRTTAVRDGDFWVLNGEKWFSSSASISDYALILARTDPDAPRHRQLKRSGPWTWPPRTPSSGRRSASRSIPPLAAWYAEVRMQHLVGGPDQVHRWRIDRNVLTAQSKYGTTASAAGGELF